jgi:hypothetical protein
MCLPLDHSSLDTDVATIRGHQTLHLKSRIEYNPHTKFKDRPDLHPVVMGGTHTAVLFCAIHFKSGRGANSE